MAAVGTTLGLGLAASRERAWALAVTTWAVQVGQARDSPSALRAQAGTFEQVGKQVSWISPPDSGSHRARLATPAHF